MVGLDPAGRAGGHALEQDLDVVAPVDRRGSSTSRTFAPPQCGACRPTSGECGAASRCARAYAGLSTLAVQADFAPGCGAPEARTPAPLRSATAQAMASAQRQACASALHQPVNFGACLAPACLTAAFGMRILTRCLRRRLRAVGERRVDRQRGADQPDAAALGGLDERRRELELDPLTLPAATRTPEKRATVWTFAAELWAAALARSEVAMMTVPSSVQATPVGQRTGTVTLLEPLPDFVDAVSVVLSFGANLRAGRGRRRRSRCPAPVSATVWRRRRCRSSATRRTRRRPTGCRRA